MPSKVISFAASGGVTILPGKERSHIVILGLWLHPESDSTIQILDTNGDKVMGNLVAVAATQTRSQIWPETNRGWGRTGIGAGFVLNSNNGNQVHGSVIYRYEP